MIKKLNFPRPNILPYQTSGGGCYAATAVGILEYFAGRKSCLPQQQFRALHNELRGRSPEDESFGSTKVLLREFGCYQSGFHKGGELKNASRFFSLVKNEIDADRPVVVQLSYCHCGVIWGYDDDSRFVYVVDPGYGPVLPVDRNGKPKGMPLVALLPRDSTRLDAANAPLAPHGFRSDGIHAYELTAYMLTKTPVDKQAILQSKFFNGTGINEQGYWGDLVYEPPAAAPVELPPELNDELADILAELNISGT